MLLWRQGVTAAANAAYPRSIVVAHRDGAQFTLDVGWDLPVAGSDPFPARLLLKALGLFIGEFRSRGG